MHRAAAILLFAAATGTQVVAAPPSREIDRAEYQNRLHGLWLAECVANWTGLKTEGRRSQPPFLTDVDWDTNAFPEAPGIHVSFVLAQNPWWADDDTDIEYVYLHLLTQHAPATRLTPPQIAEGWIAHCNWSIWVSNAAARSLMSYAGEGGANLGARPPATAFAQAWVPPSYADQSLMIDAQLTTEFFGALAPGMPGVALEMADLPIRTTATGFAAHAAQFHVVLYSLATQVDRSLPPDEQALWLVRQARKFVPDSSKAADVVDIVLADFLANPDKDDWERTRDLVYNRYQLNAAASGFRYRAWYESTVNFATGLIALLYGHMDLPRTIRIGTLSGWDSDNGTATMGGLLGLVLGYDGVMQSFAGQWPAGGPSDRYWVGRTRSNLPDHLLDDNDADDSLSLMAQRCVPVVERAITSAGGLVDDTRWLLPPCGAGDGLSSAAALLASPTGRHQLRSMNARAIALNQPPVCSTNVPGITSHWRYGTQSAVRIADNLEHNFAGSEVAAGVHGYTSTQRAAPPVAPPSPAVQSFTVEYALPATIHTVRFIEGDHFHSTSPGDYQGGWFETAAIEVRVGSVWMAVAATPSEPLDPLRPFQAIDFVLAVPMASVDAVRISGLAGGGPHTGNPEASPFVTCGELDALAAEALPLQPGFDRNLDGAIDAEDLYRAVASTPDLNADGIADAADVRYQQSAVRFHETARMHNR